MGIFLFAACVFCQPIGQAQPLTVSVTAFSSSTGATIIARAPFFTSATLEQASSLGGFANWIMLANRNFGSNDTWQYQDTGATGVAQRYYRLRSDNVYSVNIVGLYRISVGTDLALIGNPLLDTNNSVSTAFRSAANGYSLFRLTPSGFVANNYLHGWTTPTMPFVPGEGFFFQNASGVGSTLVFHGEVPLGTLITEVPAGSSLLSSKVPQAGPLEGDLEFPAQNDTVFRLNFSGFDVAVHDPDFGWEPVEPNLNVGEAFWLETDIPRNWTRNFNPNFAPGIAASAPPSPGVGDTEPAAFLPAGGPTVKVNFFTYNSSGSLGRVFDVNATGPVGSAFVGQLYASGNNSEASMIAIGGAVPFQSGQGAGYINSGLVSVPGIAPGQTIYLQLRAWESAAGTNYAIAVANGGKNGKSAIFSVAAVAPPDFGPTVPPPSANGFTSFSLNASQSAPSITLQPQSQTTTVGSNVTFCVNATGNGTLWFQWYRDGAMIGGAAGSCLPLTDVQLADAGSYTVAVNNLSGQATSSPATLTVLPFDGDADGMQDAWEVQFFGSIGAGVATADPDGDGMSNLDEFRADTNPTDAASFLRFTTIAQTFNNILVQFSTRAGIHYRVESTASLDIPGWNVINESTGDGATSSVIHSGAGSSLRQFYRLSAARGSDQPGASAVNQVGFAKVPVRPGSNQLAAPFLVSPATVENVLQVVAEDSCVVNPGQEVSCFIAGGWEPPGTSLPRGTLFEFHNPLTANQVLTFMGQVAGKPVIVQHPTNVTATAGASVSMEVSSVGASTLQHQWYFNQTNLIVGATNATLALADVQAGAVGNYSVVISNASGMATSIVSSISVVRDDFIYWTTRFNGSVKRARLNGSGVETLLTNPEPPGGSGGVGIFGGIAFDRHRGHLFTGDADHLIRANLDGSGRTNLVTVPFDSIAQRGITDVELDLDHERVYWVNNGLRVWRANLDGSSSQQLFSFSHGTPNWIEGIALDGANNHLYFANNQARTIVRGNLDGTQRINVWSLGAVEPSELEIDTSAGELYWNETAGSSVTRGNKTATGGVVALLNPGTSGYSAMHVDRTGGHIYYASSITNLMRANLDGTGAQPVLSDPDGLVYLEVLGPSLPPAVHVAVDGTIVAGTNLVVVTNSTMLSLQSTFASGAIFYTLNGGEPGTGLPYTGPVLITTSAVVRAIGYNTDYSDGTESAPVTITVVRTPAITQHPLTQTVLTAQPVTFTAAANGTVSLTYQWFFNGSPIAGATGTSFTLSGALLSHAGSYWVVASNPYGSATSTVAGLTVLLRPSIASQPSGTNVNTGENATFCVGAVGSAPLVFQWRKNGVNIPGATNSCYAITNVQATNAGAYSVVVGNGADAVTSAEAELVLADLPNGPPPEDFFANRNGLFGNPGALEVNNIGATKELGEPDHAGKPGGASVWYAWAPEESGIATLRTSGSAFDTLLAVYRGNNVAALTPVVANEDGGGFLTSEVRFNATSGVEYQIAVDGFAAAQGSFVLSWNLEATPQVLPVITNQPVSLTVTQGVTAPFSVGANGSGLKYQWYFNGARINNATNSAFTRTNVQSADVGYYAVAVTNSQNRGLLSEAAVLEIGPFPDVRSTDKVEDLIIGPQPAPLGGRARFQPASSGFASVAIGSLGTQVLNTTNSTTSFRETNHCGVIGGSSRWFKLKPAANGLMSIDTFGSTFDTVLAAYTGDPLLGGYPTRLIDCNNNAAAEARWSRVLYSATNAIEYIIAVDGANSAAGTVQLNWSLGLPPVIVSNPPPLTPLVGEGEALQLTTALTNGLPPPKLQWYLDGQLILDATNATYAVGAAQRLSGGTYTVVAYNPVGMVTSIVANVTVEVPLKLNLQPVLENGKVHFRVSGTASQTFILQGSTNFVNWQPLYTNQTAGAPVSFDDRSTTNRARRYYRALPWP